MGPLGQGWSEEAERDGRTAPPWTSAALLGGARPATVWVGVLVLVVAGTALVHATGGTRNAWLHVLYLPILLAAFRFGALGAIATALVCGLAVGPRMPVDVAAGTLQQPHNWLFRMALFVAVATAAGLGRDMLRRHHRALTASESRFRALVRNASDLILVVADDGEVRYASPSVTHLLGLEPGEVVGRPLPDLLHPTDAEVSLLPDGDGSQRTEARFAHADGSWRHLSLMTADLREDPGVGGLVINGHDVTEHRAIEAELRYHATHDPSTELANRSLLWQRVSEALEPGNGDGARRVAILLLAVDRLDGVTEAYGYAAGDRVMANLAVRLQERLIDDDCLLARYDDSTLAVLAPCVGGDRDGKVLADRLLEVARQPVAFGAEEVFLSTSVGVAVQRPGHDTDGLLTDAYTALREARRTAGRRSVLFEPHLRGEVSAWVKTESALHRALRNGELRAHFQPIVEGGDGHVVGFEALVRWLHPSRGLVLPMEFIPVAEKTGVIDHIGAWMLERSCAWLAAWRRRVPAAGDLWVSVNVSAQQLLDDDLPAIVADALGDGLPPDRLTLEITESSFATDAHRTVAMLERLRGTGVRIAVDDFGTGYSSLGVLDEMPIDVLKIDRSFVRRLGAEEDDAILSAVIGLAHSLELSAVAEGVETTAQRESLLGLGCSVQQGFLFGRPLPPDRLDLTAMLAGRALPDTATGSTTAGATPS